MIVTFDERNYHVDDDLFSRMVCRYKVLIGYVDGQRIENPMCATQYDAIQVVEQVSNMDNTYFNKLDHRIAIANAVMRAV